MLFTEVVGGCLGQRLGLIFGGGTVKIVGIKGAQPPFVPFGNIQNGDVYLRVPVGVAQRPHNAVPFQDVAVLPQLHLAPGAQPGQVALNGGQIPAIRLALKPGHQRLQGGAQAVAFVHLHKGQKFTFRFGNGGVGHVGQVVFRF